MTRTDVSLYEPCLFCCSAEVNSVTGPIGVSSADGQFREGWSFTTPKNQTSVVAHQACSAWVLAHNKRRGKNFEEILRLGGSACAVCGKDNAYLRCSVCSGSYHLLCASKRNFKLDKENFTLSCYRYLCGKPYLLQSGARRMGSFPDVEGSQLVSSFRMQYEAAFKALKAEKPEVNTTESESTSRYPVPLKNLAARKKVLVLIWYYSTKEHGFVFHGLWIGEIDVGGQLILLSNKVCPNIKKEPLFKDVLSMLDRLPVDVVEHLKTFWFDENTRYDPRRNSYVGKEKSYPSFWVYQVLKHGAQDGVLLLPDYFEKLVRLSVCENEGLKKIIEDLKTENPNQSHTCTDLSEVISNRFGKKVDLKFLGSESDSDMNVPWKLSFVYAENGEKIDHPSPSAIIKDAMFHF